jgi:polysaccharide pyruvyl transferase CsaB
VRIIVSGYYGFGNAGDEAMLAGIIAGMRGAAPDPRLTVLSGNPERTSLTHQVESIGRFDFRSLRRALRNADLLISGGGNLLQDVTSVRSCLYYLAVIRRALKARVPVVLLGQGIGPLRRRWLRALAARYLRRVRGIAVRDSQSVRELEGLGVNAAMVRVGGDVSLAMRPAEEGAVARAYRDIGVGDGEPVLAVAPRTWRIRGLNDEFLPRLTSALKHAIGRLDPPARPVFFPMQRPQDDGPCAALAGTVGGIVPQADIAPPLLAAMIGHSRAAVAMRLHALIFAAMGGAVPVAVSYDPKIEAFMSDIGLGVAANAAEIDDDRVASSIVEAWRADVDHRSALRQTMAQRRQALLETFRWAAEAACAE